MNDDDFIPPDGRSSLLASGWGFAALLIGCTLLLSACILMVFNVLMFRGGLRGVPIDVAIPAAIVGVVGVAALGVLAVSFGFRGWSGARSRGESPAFGIAGTATSLVGLVAWLIAGGDLLAVLGVFR